jgi:hypothetical protein
MWNQAKMHPPIIPHQPLPTNGSPHLGGSQSATYSDPQYLQTTYCTYHDLRLVGRDIQTRATLLHVQYHRRSHSKDRFVLLNKDTYTTRWFQIPASGLSLERNKVQQQWIRTIVQKHPFYLSILVPMFSPTVRF